MYFSSEQEDQGMSSREKMDKSAGFTAYEGECFLESEIGRGAAGEAMFHILPLPFEASVSYEGGTAEGPDAIIRASQQLELYDGTSYPGTTGIFTHAPLQTARAAPTDDEVDELFQQAAEKTTAILETGAIPVTLGGEHSISYGPIMAAADYSARRGRRLGVVQIDAHADMRLAYEGRIWSHASVMRRCADEGIPIFQLGIRALCREEVEYRNSCPHVYYHDAPELAPGLPSQINNITLPENFPDDIYLTIDLDGLDPSILPATGTPVPGGLLWYQALSLLESVIQQRRVTAFDLVELAPKLASHFSQFTAAQLVYNVMGFIQRQQPAQNQLQE